MLVIWIVSLSVIRIPPNSFFSSSPNSFVSLILMVSFSVLDF